MISPHCFALRKEFFSFFLGKLHWLKVRFEAKSLYISRSGSHFYETEYEIWADLGLVGNTEKNNWGPFMSNF